MFRIKKDITVDVCLSPELYDLHAKNNTVVAMLDAIRASATICTALMNDAECVLPVADKEKAKEYKEQGYIIAGERDGEKIKGFDYGNSPSNFSEENIKGKKLVFTTTNGTQVVDMVKNGKQRKLDLLIGSFINISSLNKKLISLEKDILILCSGWKKTVNVEDTLLAGRIVDMLRKNENLVFTEAANVAYTVFLNAGESYYDFVMKNSPRLFAKNEQLEKDFRYCLTENITDVVPYLKEDKLIV